VKRYNTTIAFHILETKVALFASETTYGPMTVAEIDGFYYQLGDQPVNLSTAIRIWEFLADRLLTKQEIEQVLIDNDLTGN
jgi:hypothetical protein